MMALFYFYDYLGLDGVSVGYAVCTYEINDFVIVNKSKLIITLPI